MTTETSIRAIFLAFVLIISTPSVADEPMELYWEDMVPEGFVEPEMTIDHMMNMSQAAPNAPVLESLNGKLVKVPGFVVPLEGSATHTKEFLLVPYFGACIHVPPPPSNQIVHVTFTEGVPIDSLYDAVWITGTITTKRWEGDIASVGYSMQGVSVELFEF